MKTKKTYKMQFIAFAILLALGFLSFWGEHNFYKLFVIEKQKTSIQAKIDTSQAIREQLNIEAERLKTDPAYIEQVAREQFKMAKSGEKIYILKDKDSQ